MAEPVLVVHGVATRDRDDFIASVKALGRRAGSDWKMIPVYWGDLGARLEHLSDSLPVMPGGVRGPGGGMDEALADELLRGMLEGGAAPVVRGEEQADVVVRAATAAKGDAPSEAVRGPDGTDALAEAIREEWPNTTYLKLLEDEGVLEAVGRAIGTAVRDGASPGVVGEGDAGGSLVRDGGGLDLGGATGGPGDLVMGGLGTDDTRGVKDSIRKLAGAVLKELDRVVGATVGHVAGNFNQKFRANIAAPVGSFLGDVFVYQRQQAAIHATLTAALAKEAPGYGTEQKPVHVVAHSLGGVIAVDMATRSPDPLWINGLVTFGSQSAFFHLVDPRERTLGVYSPGSPVALPPSIDRWTNLWHPLDPLAFVAGKVFRLHNGKAPDDRQTAHLLSHGLNTHGIYWESPDLVRAIQDTLV